MSSTSPRSPHGARTHPQRLRAYARAFPVVFVAIGIGIWGTVAVMHAHLPWYETALACWGIAIVEVMLFQLGAFLLRQGKATRETR